MDNVKTDSVVTDSVATDSEKMFPQVSAIILEEQTELSLVEAVSQVGLVIQTPFNQISGARYTVRGEIAFGLENLGTPRDQMAARVDVVAALLRITVLLDRSPYALSGGQMQLVAIASYESGHKADRIRRANRQKAERGEWHGAPKYGYALASSINQDVGALAGRGPADEPLAIATPRFHLIAGPKLESTVPPPDR